MKPLKPISTRQLVSHLTDFVNENPIRKKAIIENATHPPKATLQNAKEATKETKWDFVHSLNP